MTQQIAVREFLPDLEVKADMNKEKQGHGLDTPSYFSFYCDKCGDRATTGYFRTPEGKKWVNGTDKDEEESNLAGKIHEFKIYIPSPFERIEEVCGGTGLAYYEKATEKVVGYTNTKEQLESQLKTKEKAKETDKIRSCAPASVGERKVKVLSYKVLFREQTLDGMNYNIRRIEGMIAKRKQKPGYSVRHTNGMEGVVKKLKALRDEKEKNREGLL